MPGDGSRREIEESSWRALGEFLDAELVVLPDAARLALRERWQEIAAVERALDDRLLIGLVGGTGVGKSTLINALAADEISSTGDRRPTTARIVAYRHHATPLPAALPLEGIAEPVHTHESGALDRVILLDFPDFDSVEEPHHEIFRRYAPALDVLLVLVDDVKYADARLFDLLRLLRQSHDNLHPVFNKVDRLRGRYPDTWRQVVAEILDDLRFKLEAHAGVRVEPGRLLALSARNAFLTRAAAPSSAAPPAAARNGGREGESGELGDFPQLLDLLAGYRAEKRRRAAKELNIEAQKQAHAGRARREALGEPSLARVLRARESLTRRRRELEGLLGAIPEAVLRPEERRATVEASLRRTALRIGYPLDLLWSAVLQLRRRRPVGAVGDLSAARARQHYRAYLEGIENAGRGIDQDLTGVLPAARARAEAPPLVSTSELEALRTDFQGRIAACEARLGGRSRVWNHLLPCLVVAALLWFPAQPALENLLRRAFEEEAAPWAAFGKDLVLGYVAALNPFSLVAGAAGVLLAYLASAFIAWGRQTQRLEAAIAAAEARLRQLVREGGEAALAGVEARLARWLRERARLDELTKPWAG